MISWRVGLEDGVPFLTGQDFYGHQT
jgi:hypothetical protein